jgi:PRC-barrel domain
MQPVDRGTPTSRRDCLRRVTSPAISLDALARLWSVPAYSRTGQRIGRLDDAFAEVRGGNARWVSIAFGLVRRRHVVVPAASVQLRREAIVVDHTKARVRASPAIAGAMIDSDTDRRLNEYYGISEGDPATE